MTTLWIIRHGQASFGSSDYDQLSDTGITQSLILGRYLKSTGTTFDRVYSGTMKRQIETGRLALSELNGSHHSMDITEDPAFNEYEFKPIITAQLPGIMEEDPSMADTLPNIFKDNREFQKMFERVIQRWMSGDHDTPGVETYREYVSRVTEGLAGIASGGEEKDSIAVFTSGGVVSVAMQLALGLSDQEAMRLGWWVKNTSVTVLNYKRNRFDLLSFNSLAHLELENNKALMTFR